MPSFIKNIFDRLAQSREAKANRTAEPPRLHFQMDRAARRTRFREAEAQLRREFEGNSFLRVYAGTRPHAIMMDDIVDSSIQMRGRLRRPSPEFSTTGTERSPTETSTTHRPENEFQWARAELAEWSGWATVQEDWTDANPFLDTERERQVRLNRERSIQLQRMRLEASIVQHRAEFHRRYFAMPDAVEEPPQKQDPCPHDIAWPSFESKT